MTKSIIDYIEFTEATSIIYPWAISGDEIIKNHIKEIEDICFYDETECIYESITKIVGLNPKLSK